MTRLMLQLCGIVSALHHRTPPVIHRDIKPSNLIISPDGVLKLLDFNAAKYVTENQSADTELLGTAGYAAPEQYGFGASDAHTDLYAIGVLMNVLRTGRMPAEETAGGNLAPLIARCTELNPSDRFRSVDELAEALEKLRERAARRSASGRRRFLPPGFRTGVPEHILPARAGYISIFALGFILEGSGISPSQLLLERLTVILVGLVLVFFSENYLGVQEHFPLTNSRNRWIRLSGIVLYDIILAFVLIFVMVMIEQFLP